MGPSCYIYKMIPLYQYQVRSGVVGKQLAQNIMFSYMWHQQASNANRNIIKVGHRILPFHLYQFQSLLISVKYCITEHFLILSILSSQLTNGISRAKDSCFSGQLNGLRNWLKKLVMPVKILFLRSSGKMGQGRRKTSKFRFLFEYFISKMLIMIICFVYLIFIMYFEVTRGVWWLMYKMSLMSVSFFSFHWHYCFPQNRSIILTKANCFSYVVFKDFVCDIKQFTCTFVCQSRYKVHPLPSADNKWKITQLNLLEYQTC